VHFKTLLNVENIRFFSRKTLSCSRWYKHVIVAGIFVDNKTGAAWWRYYPPHVRGSHNRFELDHFCSALCRTVRTRQAVLLYFVAFRPRSPFKRTVILSTFAFPTQCFCLKSCEINRFLIDLIYFQWWDAATWKCIDTLQSPLCNKIIL